MPKVKAPMLSFGASGQIANSMVYSTWKGIPYTRQYAIPANPRTVKQTRNRGVFQMINAAWLFAPAAVQNAFNAFAVGKPLTGRNKFFSENQSLLATDPAPADIEGFIMSPGNGGALPATVLVVTPGDDQLTLSATIPDVPSGWEITKVHGAAIKMQAASDPFSGEWFYAFDDTAPYSVVITGLDSAVEYAVGLWIEWLKPDGKTAYSRSIAGAGTTT